MGGSTGSREQGQECLPEEGTEASESSREGERALGGSPGSPHICATSSQSVLKGTGNGIGDRCPASHPESLRKNRGGGRSHREEEKDGCRTRNREWKASKPTGNQGRIQDHELKCKDWSPARSALKAQPWHSLLKWPWAHPLCLCGHCKGGGSNNRTCTSCGPQEPTNNVCQAPSTAPAHSTCSGTVVGKSPADAVRKVSCRGLLPLTKARRPQPREGLGGECRGEEVLSTSSVWRVTRLVHKWRHRAAQRARGASGLPSAPQRGHPASPVHGHRREARRKADLKPTVVGPRPPEAQPLPTKPWLPGQQTPEQQEGHLSESDPGLKPRSAPHQRTAQEKTWH